METNHKQERSKPNIITVDKETEKCHMTDVACPFHTQVKDKEQEKQEVAVTPFIIATLGTTDSDFRTQT